MGHFETAGSDGQFPGAGRQRVINEALREVAAIDVCRQRRRRPSRLDLVPELDEHAEAAVVHVGEQQEPVEIIRVLALVAEAEQRVAVDLHPFP